MILTAINRALLIALGVTVLLLGLSGYYLKIQIAKVGELESRIDQAAEANKSAAETIETLKTELVAQAALTAKAARDKAKIQRNASTLHRQIQEALQHDTCSNRRAPDPVIDSLRASLRDEAADSQDHAAADTDD